VPLLQAEKALGDTLGRQVFSELVVEVDQEVQVHLEVQVHPEVQLNRIHRNPELGHQQCSCQGAMLEAESNTPEYLEYLEYSEVVVEAGVDGVVVET